MLQIVNRASAELCLLGGPADALAGSGCQEGSAEDAELKAIADLLDAYEQQRWPLVEIRMS